MIVRMEVWDHSNKDNISLINVREFDTDNRKAVLRMQRDQLQYVQMNCRVVLREKP